tara:strand:- start:18645 stop:20171 length:1527 start_codon:yes stop_codon:yes gene_type:complete
MTDELIFAPEEEGAEEASLEYYKILIVDDEPEIHKVTQLALTGFQFEGHKLQIISANSAKEAEIALKKNPDIAVIFLDVVMETDNAGLLLVDIIRDVLDIKQARIILRTGQPGQAPEQEVIVKYDINDYKSKTELTSQKLFTLMYSSLRSYRDIILLERSKRGLRQVIEASKGIFDKRAFNAFIAGALYQLTHLLNLDDAFVVAHDIGVFRISDAESNIYEVYNQYGIKTKIQNSNLSPSVRKVFNDAIRYQSNIYTNEYIALYCHTHLFITVFFVTPRGELSGIDKDLINLFGENVTVGLERIQLEDEVKRNQKEMVYRMGEIVETRSRETGYHVKRVALFCETLAKLAGLSSKDVETIKLASPLHDIGKISTPDSILNKPGKLTSDEWLIMQMHAVRGGEMLAGSDSYILQAASLIASTHHEKWDGSGYPEGKAGDDIPLFGRITGLADVFDALSNNRCYKNAWPPNEVIDYIQNEKGKHFDPYLVDLLLGNIELFNEILNTYKDH